MYLATKIINVFTKVHVVEVAEIIIRYRNNYLNMAPKKRKAAKAAPKKAAKRKPAKKVAKKAAPKRKRRK